MPAASGRDQANRPASRSARAPRPAATPSVAIRFASSEPKGPGWEIAWEIRNTGGEPLLLESASAPHLRFRARRRALGVAVAAGDATTVGLVARLQPTDDAAPNPFLMLRVVHRGAPWLVLARLRVEQRGGRVEARVRRVSVQPVGFSILPARRTPTRKSGAARRRAMTRNDEG